MTDLMNSTYNGIRGYSTGITGMSMPQNKPVCSYSNNDSTSSTSPANYVFARPAANSVYSDNQLMFSRLYNGTDDEGRSLLLKVNKAKKLLSRDADDGSSTLQNLYKIMTEPRAKGFKNHAVLIETLRTLADPYRITQNFEKIPKEYIPAILKIENRRLSAKIASEKANKTYNPETATDRYPLKSKDIDFWHGATCPAASLEFSLADKHPAEFARFIEGLSSPQKSTKIKVKYADLHPDKNEAIKALTEQKAEFKEIDKETAEITVRPDANAFLRAEVAQNYRHSNLRSLVDVLAQSAVMQLGSAGTYNSLTDKRSNIVTGGQGLNQSEIAFAESILESKSREVPVLYMEFNDDATNITKHYYSTETVKGQFIDSLKKGDDIIVGYMTDLGKNDKINSLSGHEILLTGFEYDKNGKLIFKYNDSDDGNNFTPSWIAADKLLPAVHHANIPESVVKKYPPAQQLQSS